jgi:hypothetical protein
MQGKKNAKKQVVTADAEMEEVKSEQAALPKKSRSRTPPLKNQQQRQPLHAPPTTTDSKRKIRTPAKVIESEVVTPIEASTTKKATEIKKTKASSGRRQAVTQAQVHEIVSSAMELEPKGKGKGSKSPRPPKVQASPTPAPVTPVPQPKSARKHSKDQVPTPQEVAAAKKQTKSPAPNKVA